VNLLSLSQEERRGNGSESAVPHENEISDKTNTLRSRLGPGEQLICANYFFLF